MVEKFFKVPFANSGTKTTVPDDSQPSGDVSYTDGFTVDYELDQATNPSAKDIPRPKFNEIVYDITQALRQLQTLSAPSFITSAANGGSAYSYAKGVRVQWTDGKIYQSRVASNNTDPTNTTNWQEVTDAASVPDASTTVKGIIEIATSAESVGGTDSTRAITSAAFAAFKNIAAQGYYQFPGGLIVQWGQIASTGAATGTFPIAFPTACLRIIGNQWGTSQGPFATALQQSSANPLTQFSYLVSSGGLNIGCDYIAIGN